MAETLHVVIDSAGRTVDIEPGQWEAMKQSITTGMQAVVGEVTKVASEISKSSALAKTDELLKSFVEFKTEYDKNAQSDNKLLTVISNSLGTLNSNLGGELAEVRPVSHGLLAGITGMGSAKIEHYGHELLELIRNEG